MSELIDYLKNELRKFEYIPEIPSGYLKQYLETLKNSCLSGQQEGKVLPTHALLMRHRENLRK